MWTEKERVSICIALKRNLHPFRPCLGVEWMSLLRGFEPHSHPRTESSRVGLGWQCNNNQNRIKSSTEGQEPRNVEVIRSKVQARSKMAKHKLKPWQRVEWGKNTQTATGIEAQGKKRSSWSQKRGTAERQLECKLNIILNLDSMSWTYQSYTVTVSWHVEASPWA